MLRAPIEDEKVRKLLDELADDGLGTFLLGTDQVRGALLHGTRLVNQMRANHELGLVETFVLGHGYLAGGLLTANLKGNDRIGFAFSGDGPAEGLSIESTAQGTVRGYLKRSPIPLEGPITQFDMSPLIGFGSLSVTRYMEKAKNPFTGQISLDYGNIAQDLSNYYVRSEQTPTSFSLSVQFDEDGRVVGAGGLMVQGLPRAEESLLAELDHKIRRVPSIGAAFAEGAGVEDFLKEALGEFDPVIIDEREVVFDCHCSKERFARFLSALPIDEIQDMRDNGPFPIRTTCHNCNSTYEFSREEIDHAYQLSR
jgi:molecular chaperone Hsp33